MGEQSKGLYPREAYTTCSLRRTSGVAAFQICEHASTSASEHSL